MKSWLKYSSLCRKSGRLALSHKTLVTLLGTDPSKQADQPLPTTYPQVTFAYMKHMWNENKKVGVEEFPWGGGGDNREGGADSPSCFIPQGPG